MSPTPAITDSPAAISKASLLIATAPYIVALALTIPNATTRRLTDYTHVRAVCARALRSNVQRTRVTKMMIVAVAAATTGAARAVLITDV